MYLMNIISKKDSANKFWKLQAGALVRQVFSLLLNSETFRLKLNS